MASASNSVSNSTRDLLSLGNVSNMSHSDADLSEAWRQVYASTKLTEAAAACCFSDLDAMLFVPCSKYQLEPKVDMDDGTIEVEGNYVDLCRFSVHIWSSQSGKSSPAPPKQPLPKRESPTKFLPSPTSDPEDPYGTTPFASNPAAEADSLSSSRFSSRSFRTKASTLHYVQEKLAGQLSEIETAHHVRILALPGEDPAEAIVTINAADTGKAQVDKGYSEVTDFVNAVSQQLVELKIDVPREVEAEARTKCDDLLRGSTNSVVMDIDDTGRAVTLIGGRDDVADAAAKVERLIWNLRSRSPREPLKLTAEGIVVKQADIVREKADVFLVTTSVGAFMTSGLSQRVIAEAGGEVGLACAEEIKKSGGKIKPRLFVTSGGQLPCNYIIHMIFPNNFQAKSAVPLKQTYFSGLELAGSAKLKARSVAIPCPDSIPLVACSTPIPYAVNQYMEAMGEASTVKQVVFVCENASTMMAFKRGLESLRPVQKGSPKSLSKAPAPAPAPTPTTGPAQPLHVKTTMPQSWTTFPSQFPSQGASAQDINRQQEEEQRRLLQQQQLLQQKTQQLQRKGSQSSTGVLPGPPASPNKRRAGPFSGAMPPTGGVGGVGGGAIRPSPVHTMSPTLSPASAATLQNPFEGVKGGGEVEVKPAPVKSVEEQGEDFFASFESAPSMQAVPQKPVEEFAVFRESFQTQSAPTPLAPVSMGAGPLPEIIPTQPEEPKVDDSKVKELKERVAVQDAQLSALDKEKIRIEKEKESLMRKYEAAEKELGEKAKVLNEQKEKYAELQKKHIEEIQQIREGGHEALAVIVEEYKELSKTAVLEQQERSQQQLQAALKEEAEKCEKLLLEQKDRLSETLNLEQEANKQKMGEAIEALREETKVLLEKSIEEERSRGLEALEKVVSSERENGLKALEKAVEEERQKAEELLEEHKKETVKQIDEQKEEFKRAISEAISEEQEKSKESIKEAVQAERHLSEAALSEAVAQAKESVVESMKEQERIADAGRQRHLMALDLFLQSASKQLQSLMSSPE
eukprot:m.5084 g.5084  ORF g.5084 m.5084 type:complete len:1029 (+) comp12059_c0_seq1:220-3306(+)